MFNDFNNSRLFDMRAGFLAISATLLGLAIRLRDGAYNPLAMTAMTIALLVLLVAIIKPHFGKIRWAHFRLLLLILFLIQLAALMIIPVGSDPRVNNRAIYAIASCVAIPAALTVVFAKRRFAQVAIVCAMLAYAAVCLWLIHVDPHPQRIDVYDFQKIAIDELRDGKNPYAIDLPNIYQPGSYVYAPQLMRGDRVLFGYPYFPLPLLAGAPAQLMLGDYRYGHVAMMLIAAGLLLAIRSDAVGKLAVICLLFTPEGFFIIDRGWTEPLLVMLLMTLLFIAIKAPRWIFIPIGLLLAAKQYMPAMILFLPLLYGGFNRRMLIDCLLAILLASAIILPFALWDFHAFWHSTIEVQLQQPFRSDALSFLVWIGENHLGKFSNLLGFFGMIAGVGLAYWKLPRTVGGFILAFTLSYFLFFAFNKQAFANYYFLIIAGLWASFATFDLPKDSVAI